MTKRSFTLALAVFFVSACASAAKNDSIKQEDLRKVVASAKTTVPAEPQEQVKGDDAEAELPPAKVPVSVKTKPAPGTEQAEPAPQEDGMAISVKPAEPEAEPAKAEPTSPAVEAKKPAPAPAVSSSVSAEQSLKWLTNGNTRYATKRFRADGRLQADRDRTKNEQHPHAIVLSCADSRVPPEHIFDQGLGEIFTIRVAGEALDSSVIASVEYAVEHLGSHLLVVMGHTKCGAISAALGIPADQSAGSEALDKLLAEVRPHLKSRTSEKPSKDLEIESALNADGVARDLVARSAIVKAKVASGELKIKSALYWLDTGRVKFY